MKAHLIGIGGIGMSGIAQLLLTQGHQVSGSDSCDNPLLDRVRAMGGQVRIGHAALHVNGADLVVYSSSISPRNPELTAARNRGIPVVHRGQMLSRLIARKRTVAIAGSHGKSTTAALSGALLAAAGLDPTVMLGAELESLGGNVRIGEGAHAVVEADESDGSLLWLEPAVAIVTNMDEEHLDYFRNAGEILETYAAFAERVPASGFLIGCADDPVVRRLMASAGKRTITYGLSSDAQIAAGEIESGPGWSRFVCRQAGKKRGSVRLQIPGIHNVLNSLAAIGLGQALGIEFCVVKSVLEEYRGAKRRFQIHGEAAGVLVVEDYGHHPAEIQSTLQAARSWKGRRIRCVFQPHRYSRTRYLLSRFGSSFAQADELILLPIYSASEDPVDGVTSEILLKSVQASGGLPVALRSPEEALERLASDSQPNDLVLFLGAGSVGGLARRFLEMLTRRATQKECSQHAA